MGASRGALLLLRPPSAVLMTLQRDKPRVPGLVKWKRVPPCAERQSETKDVQGINRQKGLM